MFNNIYILEASMHFIHSKDIYYLLHIDGMKKKTNVITFVEVGFSSQKIVHKPMEQMKYILFCNDKNWHRESKTENMNAEELEQ